MKTILWIASGIILLLGSTEVQNLSKMMTVDAPVVAPDDREDDEPIVVRGHVRDDLGVPIEGVSVSLRIGGAVVYQSYTNSSGFYKMTGVESGNYALRFEAADYTPKQVSLYIGSETVRTDTLYTE